MSFIRASLVLFPLSLAFAAHGSARGQLQRRPERPVEFDGIGYGGLGHIPTLDPCSCAHQLCDQQLHRIDERGAASHRGGHVVRGDRPVCFDGIYFHGRSHRRRRHIARECGAWCYYVGPQNGLLRCQDGKQFECGERFCAMAHYRVRRLEGGCR